MTTNKTSKVFKILILVLSLIVFAFSIFLLVWAKIDYVNAGQEGWSGLGFAIVIAIVLIYGGLAQTVILLTSFVWLIISIVQKKRRAKQVDALTQEGQVLIENSNVKHFLLLTFLPLVSYVITVITVLVIS